MKKASLVILLIGILALIGSGQTAASTPKPEPKPDVFKELVAKLKTGDTSIDFKALRVSSMDSDEDEASEADRDLKSKMFAAYDAKKYKDAIKAGEEVLKAGYLDIDTHIGLALANRELGEAKRFDFHKAVYLGLINSILSGADGKTPETAYVVINVGEEYALLRALDLRRGNQALQTVDGHKYDVLTVTDPKTNETKKVYFNIDLVWKGYEKIFK